MQLIPYFQPIVDIATAKVVGHEALARMIDHSGNVRSAGQIFCDHTLDEQKVLAFDRAVRLQAIQRFADAGQPGFLTLNISPRWVDLLGDQWIPTVEMLDLYQVDPRKIVVEIVETHSNPEKLADIVKRYKALGMRVAVDDFGAGYSQFDRVIKLAPDIVKLDMRLFKKAMKGGFPQHIVHSLSFLAERMGSQVLCEGVENYDELRFALEIGSKLIQGYMFSEAKSQFTEVGMFERNIAIQRRRFLLESMRKEEKALDDSRKVQHQVEAVCQQIREHGLVIDTSMVDNTQIYSMFVANTGGTQISPTYKVIENEWQITHEFFGHNWCWRPYFYQLLSSAETMQRKSVTSRQYHDALSGALVKTIACFIDENRVLLVDIKQHHGFEH
jgi:EAL domain-containing protein (putative c-di-GMP-specific phosphodiesterase class I)